MYVSQKEAAIAMYGGMMGAYLSAEVPAIDRETRELLREAIHWLREQSVVTIAWVGVGGVGYRTNGWGETLMTI